MSPKLLQFLRFGVVGLVNTGTFYLLYLACHPYLPYFAAYSLAFLLSTVGSFFMNTYFTYRTRPSWRKFLLFPLTYATNYLVQSLGLIVLVQWLDMNDKIAPLLAALLAVPFTYLLSKRILTHRNPAEEPVPAAGPASLQGEDLGSSPVDVEVVHNQ